jgi:uncharacterized protein
MMADIYIWGGIVRFFQSLASAAPFILVGFLIAGIFRRLMGREMTVQLFGGSSRASLLRAWGIGMLLPVCSLGVIPVIREMRRMGLKGGTILAFAMSAPLFNPLSLLYGLTLSKPLAILAFAFCSLIVVTGVGLIWDRLFPHSASEEPAAPDVRHGLRRMLSIAVVALREAGGVSMLYILLGLLGVSLLGVIIPSGALQHAMNGDNPVAPLTMTAVAIPAYATPMLAMSQLGMMFQHANSPGAAFVLLALGAGMNLGLMAWIVMQYGLRRSLVWFGLLLVIVLGLAYGVDRPLYPTEIEAADHTHAFDIYCRPFTEGTTKIAETAISKLKRDIQPYELYAATCLGVICVIGLILNLVDRKQRVEEWLERRPPLPTASRFDIVLPGPVLGGIALVGLIVTSVVGCYAYYPSPQEVVEEMSVAKAEALGAALSGDVTHAKYWIEVYDDWSRKLEVGAFLRDWQLSDYHRMKASLLREQLELLKHEIEDREMENVRMMVAMIGRSQLRLNRAFLEER